MHEEEQIGDHTLGGGLGETSEDTEVLRLLGRMWNEGVLPPWALRSLPSLPVPLSRLSPRSLFSRPKVQEAKQDDE